MTQERKFVTVKPLFARPGENTVAAKYELSDEQMLPETAYQIVHDETMLDGNARLNLATFVGTWIDDHANRLYAESCDKNMIDKDEYPQTAEMTMEGLYEASGDWAYTVGLPGKSGVGGGIMCVAPGLLSIAAFSPRLDQFGNSVRAQAAITQIAQELKLNLYLGTGEPRAATQLGVSSGITNEALVSTPH